MENKKVLMYRYQGDIEWIIYDDDTPVMELDDYEVHKI